jgi:hypothetical protein
MFSKNMSSPVRSRYGTPLLVTNKIGQDFTTAIKLHLLPSILLPRGYYQSTIQYVTDTSGVITMHHQSFNTGGDPDDFMAVVGRDVREITFSVYRHNSFPGTPHVHYQYTLRVDRLILLNLACMLLNIK